MTFSSVAVVLPHRIPQLWDACEPLVERALLAAPVRRPATEIRALLVAGKLELIVGFGDPGKVEALLVVRYERSGSGFMAHIQLAAGRGVSSARAEWAQLLQWLRHKGVSRLTLHCQAAQERLWRRMGFATTYRVMWLELSDAED